MKNDIAIKTDVFKHLKTTPLVSAVTGVLRKTGKRPKNSKKEDIVITILANQFGQLQKATVNVNIYVAANVVDGQAEEETKRLDFLCDLATESLKVFRGNDYRAELKEQRVFEVEGADEYVIHNKIEYKQINE